MYEQQQQQQLSLELCLAQSIDVCPLVAPWLLLLLLICFLSHLISLLLHLARVLILPFLSSLIERQFLFPNRPHALDGNSRGLFEVLMLMLLMLFIVDELQL